MIWLDRCGYCKHVREDSNVGHFRCEAFPNGTPRGFFEDGKVCNNGYRFEVDESKKERYQKIWEGPPSPPKLEKPLISPNGKVYVE